MRWSLYLMRANIWKRPSYWIVLPSCYPSVFGMDWDTLNTRAIRMAGFEARKLVESLQGDLYFTEAGLLYFAAFHKDAAERVPALRQWLELQQIVEELKASAI